MRNARRFGLWVGFRIIRRNILENSKKMRGKGGLELLMKNSKNARLGGLELFV